MATPTQAPSGFKRQVVFRLCPEEWPLLEEAVRQHGSIQAAVLAGLRALTSAPITEARSKAAAPESSITEVPPPAEKQATRAPSEARSRSGDMTKEITAREAAQLLGLERSTIRSYIRSGRIPGRYEGGPSGRGWLTTRVAAEAYRAART
jgi:predicted DNA-binding transcriptional regulator AlpA